MNKKVLYICIGVGVCLAILGLSLGLYFGLRDDDQQHLEGPLKNDGTQKTPLDEYVYSQESLSQFSWFHAEEFDFAGTNIFTNVSYQAYVLNMTSGLWQSEAEVGDRHRWWHVFVVIIPENLRPEYRSHGYIYVSLYDNTRNNGTGMTDGNDDYTIIEASTMATGVGMPVAICYQVPNQPIYFASDPSNKRRREDAIVAFTWAMYFKDMSRPELNVYFGMVRAAVRAMDAMTEFMKDRFAVDMEDFMFTGESKRGWTTWLTAAVEHFERKRVKAIVPSVWDGINLQEVFQNQWQSFNGWSFAIADYVENGITTKLGSPEEIHLQNMIDPYFYRSRLTVPKLVITGVRDEFQMVDDERYWWDRLPSGPIGQGLSDGNTKWLLKGPNLEHNTAGISSMFITGAWVSYLLNDWDIPYLTWDYDPQNGDVTAHPKGGNVLSVSMWHATTCNNARRDFRAAKVPPCECDMEMSTYGVCVVTGDTWSEVKLQPNGDGNSFTGHLEPPADGRWSAFVLTVQMSTNYTKDPGNPNHTFFTAQTPMSESLPQVKGRPLEAGGKVLTAEPRIQFIKPPPGAFQFTSRASVVPDTFPYPPCSLEGCNGPLV